jgi:hypothetical protein
MSPDQDRHDYVLLGPVSMVIQMFDIPLQDWICIPVCTQSLDMMHTCCPRPFDLAVVLRPVLVTVCITDECV